MTAAAAAPPADVLDPTGFSSLLLSLSVSGVMLMRPRYEADGEIVDFDGVRLNPAAQQMLRLPECPAESFLTLYPTAKQAGVFDFYCEAFRSDTVARRQNLYQLDGLDGYYLLVAQRYQDLLVVSFTDTNDQPRTPVEEALRESQARVQAARAEAESQRQRFYDLLMQLPANVAVNEGPDQVFTLVNPGYQRQAPGLHLLGKPIRQVWPELVDHGILNELGRVYQTGEPFTATEMPVQVDLTRTGQLEQRYYTFFFLPLRDAQGQLNGVLNFSYNVTDSVVARQQVEQLNAELEARVQARTQEALALQADLLAAAQRQLQVRESFYQVFEQTPAAVSLLRGPTYRFEYVNPVYQQVFAGRQLVGHDFAEALPDAAAQGYLTMLDGVYRTGETFFGAEMPFVSEQPDTPPHTVYFNFTYQAYRENGVIVGISTFALDVTEQVLARQERETQRQQLYTVFEQAPIGIAIQAGPDLVYEFHNPSYLWMVPDRQLVGKRFFDVFPEMAGTHVQTLLRHVYETGETQQEHELLVPVARADGSTELEDRYFTVVYQARRNKQGHINGILAFVMEVTEQVQARQQVQALNEELAAINEELAAINEELTATNEELNTTNTRLTRTNIDLDNFIYTASHDLKAPITNIEGLLLALEHELPETARTGDVPLMLTMMQDAVDRFRRTITHLTDLSRLQKEHNPASDAVALAPVVEAVRLDLTPLLTHTQGQLTVTIPEGLTVTFAEKNLRSVVYNLLSNAFKYHHPDRVPEVRLRSWLADDYAVLEVQDNGLGLDLARGQERLFAMFQRLHTHVEGTGVGLYMVKRIVENAGGRIEVTSQLGQGSTFQIYFPR